MIAIRSNGYTAMMLEVIAALSPPSTKKDAEKRVPPDGAARSCLLSMKCQRRTSGAGSRQLLQRVASMSSSLAHLTPLSTRKKSGLTDGAESLEEFEDAHSEAVCDYFNRVKRRVCLTSFHSTQVRLIEAALLGELHLRQASGETELSHALSESPCQSGFHTKNCRCYAPIHINTNSYILAVGWRLEWRHA